MIIIDYELLLINIIIIKINDYHMGGIRQTDTEGPCQ